MKKLFTYLWISLATMMIMLMAGILIIFLYIAKFFVKLRLRDNFQDSRRHPLNSPTATRG